MNQRDEFQCKIVDGETERFASPQIISSVWFHIAIPIHIFHKPQWGI